DPGRISGRHQVVEYFHHAGYVLIERPRRFAAWFGLNSIFTSARQKRQAMIFRKIVKQRRGVIVILACFAVVVVLGVVALSVDGRMLLADRRHAQAAADAAAYSGACDLYDNYYTQFGKD